MGDVENDDATAPEPSRATVYWRPGCGFCGRLLRALEKAGVAVDLHNIWDDDEARAFVRQHNRGNETVPTVVVGGDVWTNPDARVVIAATRRGAPARRVDPAAERLRLG
jgi:mycoredoxin